MILAQSGAPAAIVDHTSRCNSCSTNTSRPTTIPATAPADEPEPGSDTEEETLV